MTDKSIAERLCEAAEIDLGLPYSLMQDVWDRIELGGMEATLRPIFEQALAEALNRWDADQTGYQFNARALIDYGYDPADDADAWTEPVPPTEEEGMRKALEYVGLDPDEALKD